jgi:hypothetical protein
MKSDAGTVLVTASIAISTLVGFSSTAPAANSVALRVVDYYGNIGTIVPYMESWVPNSSAVA